MVWGLYNTLYPIEKMTGTQSNVLLIYLTWCLETQSDFHGWISQPKINSLAYYTHFFFQATSQNKLSLNLYLGKNVIQYINSWIHCSY